MSDTRRRDVQVSVVVMSVWFLVIIVRLSRVEKLKLFEGLSKGVLEPICIVKHKMNVGLTVGNSNTLNTFWMLVWKMVINSKVAHLANQQAVVGSLQYPFLVETWYIQLPAPSIGYQYERKLVNPEERCKESNQPQKPRRKSCYLNKKLHTGICLFKINTHLYHHQFCKHLDEGMFR